MSEPMKPRVVLERVEWSHLVLFPSLTRAFALATQPGRLMTGLALVVVLMASGALWDVLTPATVRPGSLLGAPVDTDALESDIVSRLRDPAVLPDETLGELLGGGQAFDPARIREAVIENFRNLSEEEAAAIRPEVEAIVADLGTLVPRDTFAATVEALTRTWDEATGELLALRPFEALRVTGRGYLALFEGLLADHGWFLGIFGTWTFILWIIGGGMICRSVACEFTINQHVGWPQTLAFSLRRWIPLVGTFVLPLLLVVLVAIPLAIGGVLFRIPVVNILAGVLYGVALLLGFLGALVIVLGGAASLLFVPAIAVESTDAPDAISRAFSYVKNRPFHLLFHALIALGLLLLGYLVVWAVAMVTARFTLACAGMTGGETLAFFQNAWGTGRVGFPSFDAEWQLGGTSRIAAGLVDFWHRLLAAVVVGFVIVHEFALFTVLYFIMRKVTDDQDMDDIWQPGLIEGTMAPDRARVGEIEPDAPETSAD